MTTEATKTEVGSYFIANYPPFSQWTAEQLPEIEAALARAAAATCRWACTCTFPSAASAASSATSASTPTRTRHDVETLRRGPVARDRAGQPAAGDGRPAVPLRLLRRRHAVVPQSAKQLTSLVDRLRANVNWDQAEEVTFECEPGTLCAAEGRRRSRSWASRG